MILWFWLQIPIFRLLHEEKWEQHLEHALTVVHIMGEAVELNNSLCILEQPWRVFQDGRAGDVVCHFVGEAPLLLNPFLFSPETLHILLNFLAK